MKATQTLTTASALLCALPASVVALSKVETRNLDVAGDDASRGLMHLVSHFANILLFYVVRIVVVVFGYFSSWGIRSMASHK